MKPSQAEHDTLAFRLAGILLKLNLGEIFSCETLAEEFKVSERTIYRDLNRLGGMIKLLPRQETVKQLENGGLIISSQISHANHRTDVGCIYAPWCMECTLVPIPRVKILEPAWLQESLENELRKYLQ